MTDDIKRARYIKECVDALQNTTEKNGFALISEKTLIAIMREYRRRYNPPPEPGMVCKGEGRPQGIEENMRRYEERKRLEAKKRKENNDKVIPLHRRPPRKDR